MEHDENENWKLWVVMGILGIFAAIAIWAHETSPKQEWIATMTANGDLVTNPDHCTITPFDSGDGTAYSLMCNKR